jgi:hypothetical protein
VNPGLPEALHHQTALLREAPPMALKTAALEAKARGKKDPDGVVRLAERLHLVICQLRERRENRPTLDVVDEYDVQDLFHALLRIDFDDVRDEEWAPSYAGCHPQIRRQRDL